MTDLLKWFQTLPLFKLVFVFGVILVLVSIGAHIPGMAVEVPERLDVFAFIGGFSLIVIAAVINEQNKNRAVQVQEMDKEIREVKIAAGLDPAKDKTVIKLPD